MALSIYIRPSYADWLRRLVAAFHFYCRFKRTGTPHTTGSRSFLLSTETVVLALDRQNALFFLGHIDLLSRIDLETID